MKKINLLIFLISIISIMVGCGQGGSLTQRKKHVTRDISRALRVDSVESGINKRNKGAGAQVAGEQVTGAQVAGEQVAGAQVAGEQVAGAQVAGEQVAGAQVAGEQGAGAQVAGEQGVGAQVAGEQGVGAQVADEQGVGAQVADEQGVGAQVADEQGVGAQVADEQGVGAQVAGEQGVGAQVAGEQGVGAQVAGEQGVGAQVADEQEGDEQRRSAIDIAYEMLTLRLDKHRETLDSRVDERVFIKAGFDPSTSLFGDQKVSKKVEYFNQSDIKNKIYLALGNDVRSVLVLRSIFKSLDLSIERSDLKYDGSETNVMVDVLYLLYNVSEHASYNLNLNFNEERLNLIKNCNSADKISTIDLKLREIIAIREGLISMIERELYLAHSYRVDKEGNKEKMLNTLKEMIDDNGQIRSAIRQLFRLIIDIKLLIRS
ncbi:hypothetical protein [Borrelia puertoricensis]|uniref:hypothetical protein n=1 Tax=Borrelia puertoricensis TaxID=2756107 RepID=UPI001FF6F4E3|nr:hypothetical protein [Borrelia puertoricensis]UPA18951.1 hypothetical protein bpuSUM_001489 [Borrelia puertoricensis]